MKKFTYFAIAICIGISIMLTGCSCSKNKNLIRVNEVTHSIFYAPMYVAINKGFFEEEKIKIELTNGGGANVSMNALIAGSADIGLMGPEAAIYTGKIKNIRIKLYKYLKFYLLKLDKHYLK